MRSLAPVDSRSASAMSVECAPSSSPSGALFSPLESIKGKPFASTAVSRAEALNPAFRSCTDAAVDAAEKGERGPGDSNGELRSGGSNLEASSGTKLRGRPTLQGRALAVSADGVALVLPESAQDQSGQPFPDVSLLLGDTWKNIRRVRLRIHLGPSGKRLLSGAIAGAASRTAVAPLETIRTHLMVGSTSQKSVSGVFKWILETEGWKGLFRGNGINVIRVAPSKAIELFTYDTVKKTLTKEENGQAVSRVPLPFPVSSIAGSCAGIASCVLMYPLELVKTRLTVQKGAYRGMGHAFQTIVQQEGFMGLYRGLFASVVGVIPYAGANYFAYDTLRTLYKKVTKRQRIGHLPTLLIGSTAGAFAASATFPLEVARKQMQMGSLNGRVVYGNTVECMLAILKEQGPQGLYRGLAPSCIKLVPAAGISFMCYEALKRVLLEDEEIDTKRSKGPI